MALGSFRLAFDRSVREIDEFGRLHVRVAHISKANVCPYWGREIPNYEELGLKANEMYYLYRHPDELSEAAGTFNNLPILGKHIPHSADEPRKRDTIGSTGTDAVFRAPYLNNSLVIWDGEAIALIESGDQKELSCGYAYRADMTPGEINGEKYDGIMRDIKGNHVALVEEGRAGRDVVIGDALPRKIKEMMEMAKVAKARSRKALLVQGALASYLAPRLAADAKIDLSPVVANITRTNYGFSRARILNDVRRLTQGKLAKDADIADLVELLDAMENVNNGNPDDDEVDAVDTEREDVEAAPSPAAEKPGAAPAEAGAPAPAGGEGGGIVEELKAAGCPPELLQKVMAAVGGGGGAPSAAPPAAAAPAGQAEGGPPPEKPKGQDESAEEMMPKASAEDEDDDEDEDDEPKGEDDGEGTSDDNRGGDKDELSKLGEAEGGPDKSPPGENPLKVDNGKEGSAMDKQISMDQAIATAVRKERVRSRNLQEAQRIVRPHIGDIEVGANDSASDLYRMALEAHNVNLEGVHPSAFKAMVGLLPKPSVDGGVPRIAEDAAMVKNQAERLPNLHRIRSIG